MKYRLSMFWWKIHCAWCDVKIAFGYLLNSKGKPVCAPIQPVEQG